MNLVRVGEISRQIRGVSYDKVEASKSPSPGLVPILRANNISDGEINLDDLVYVPSRRVKADQYLITGDVLIATSSGSIDIVGKAGSVRRDLNAGFGAFCKVLRPNAQVWPGYFAHFFQTQRYRQIVSGLAAGANINNLRNEHLDNLEIPLPPLPEQRRIAAVLDAADALRAKRRAALAKLDALLQSVFLEMFGDPATKRLPIEEAVFKIIDYRGKTPPKTSEGVPLITAKIIRDGYIEEPGEFISEQFYQQWMRRGYPEIGDVLFTTEAPLGKVAQLKRADVALAQRVVLLRGNPGILDNRYLAHCLTMPEVRSQIDRFSTGTTVKGIRQRELRKVEIPIPDIGKQQLFNNIALKLDANRFDSRKSLGFVDELFNSLQQRAFRDGL